jgi:hypothetical protein
MREREVSILLTINLILLIWLVVADRNVQGSSGGWDGGFYVWEVNHHKEGKAKAWLWFIFCSAINLLILITEGWV